MPRIGRQRPARGNQPPRRLRRHGPVAEEQIQDVRQRRRRNRQENPAPVNIAPPQQLPVNLNREPPAQLPAQPPAEQQPVPVHNQPVLPAANLPIQQNLPVQPLEPPPPPMIQAPLAVVNAPGPQNNGEIITNDPILIPNQYECDVYVSQALKDKIWNREYIDLALLLYQNFMSQVDKPQGVVGYDSVNGTLVVQSNKNSKVKAIKNIELWTDAFINYTKILLQKFPNLASDLIAYLSIIRGAGVPFERIYRYDQQFRLRMANNPTRSWSSIDGILWFTIIANGTSNTTTSVNYQINNRGYCWDFNFKCFCTRQTCFFRHACMKCGLAHPFAYCQQSTNKNINRTNFSRPQDYGSVRYRQNLIKPQQNFIRAPPVYQPPRQKVDRFPLLRLPGQLNSMY